MRKLIPCYLCGFASAQQQLQRALFAAASVTDWQAACADPERWGFDPAEPWPAAALRRARLKGSGQQHRGAAQQRVVLPPNWLQEGDGDDDVALLLDDVAACEG
jgi:hypothetical protein